MTIWLILCAGSPLPVDARQDQDPVAEPTLATFEPVELVRRVQPSVVTLHALDISGRRIGLSSGFVIEGGWIATTRHGLLTADAAEIELADGRVVPVLGVGASDTRKDLALLAIAWPEGVERPAALEFADATPPSGTRVMAFGSPLGIGETVSDGLVSAYGKQPGVGEVLTISAPISPGSSGGPVVDFRSRVVGMVRGQYQGGQNLNFATPSFFLAALNPGKTIPLRQWAMDSSTTIASPEVNALVAQAIHLFQRNEFEESLRLANRATGVAPSLVPAWHIQALGQWQLGLHADALQSFERALRLVPNDAPILSNYAGLLKDFGRPNEAIAIYKRTLDAAPGFIPALHNLATLYEERGNLDLAAHWYRKLLERDANHYPATSGLARIAMRRGNHEQAAAAYETVLAAHPDDYRALRNLAGAYKNLGRMDEAVEALHRCLALNPNYQDAREYQAHLLGELGRIEEQYVQLKELLRRYPGSVPGHYQMGVLFLNRGDRAEAFAEYQILQGFEGSPGVELLDLIYPD